MDVLSRIKGDLEPCAALIRASDDILVTMHVRPDGDAVGAALAAFWAFKALGKNVTLYNPDGIPRNFAFLEGSEYCLSELPFDVRFDLTVVLDCANMSLLGSALPDNALGKKILFVDHHAAPCKDADLNLHDSEASAAGEVLWYLIDYMNIALTPAIANALYTSILTDTGSFRYLATSPAALRIAALCVEAGAEVWKISSNVYESNPPERLKLLALVLKTLTFGADGEVASIHCHYGMLRSTGCHGSLTDGFVNFARGIEGVEVALFFTQVGQKKYRCSMRSCGTFDVSAIAEKFGGGGHVNAAACTLNGEVCSLREKMIAEYISVRDRKYRNNNADDAKND